MKYIKTVSGIDSIYFYIESQERYIKLYRDIKNSIDSHLRYFAINKIEFENAQITLEINSQSLYYSGKGEGFIWLRDINDLYIIGFKHPDSEMVSQHDIRVKLTARGIYEFGITECLKLIRGKLLNGYIKEYMPITRVDLNSFVNTDLSFLNKSMFVSKKQNHHQLYEDIGSQNDISTLYIGKKPFMLRIYNKTKELAKNPKREMMEEYFRLNGLDTKEQIFNIEFELHRDFLKSYHIDTVDDALQNGEMLFRECCELIRMVELSTLSQSDIKHNKIGKAKTHPLWEHIKESYTLGAYLQNKEGLSKREKTRSVYTLEKFKEELENLLLKAIGYNLIITLHILEEALKRVRHEKSRL